MSDQGDLHNFGQSVQAVERASGSYFQKPRSIYWEWLFFGRTSPLAPYFSGVGGGSISPGDCLFNLDVEMNENFTGYSRRVVPSTSDEISLDHAYSLGVLLAYCYVFGIRDLHRHNLIRTDTHLQVVDAEVVLVSLLLPNETLLLPFKDIGPDLAAISHLGPDLAGLSMESITAILRGYCDTFDCILKNLIAIQKIFSDRQAETNRVPIRHIARDTIHYRQWKYAAPEIPYFSDELEQLERGDIPYFFKFIADPSLYQYTDAAGRFAEINVPIDFAKAIARDATDPVDLVTMARIEKKLFPTGLLFLAKRLLGVGVNSDLRFGQTTLSQDEGVLTVSIRNQKYQLECGR